jgi:hypothetical protein
MQMQALNVEVRQEVLPELRITEARELVFRLMLIEAELAELIARSSDGDDPEGGFAKFYRQVVTIRQAAQAAIYAQEAR